MRRVHRWRAPHWLRIWMIAATRGGDGWLWLGMGMVIAMFGGSERLPALSAAAVSTGAGTAVFLKLKRLTGRRRPCALEPHCWAACCRPISFRFPPDTRLRRSRWQLRWLVLSGFANAPAILRGQCSGFPHSAGDALSYRRDRRCGPGHAAGLVSAGVLA